ncbi:lysophospholipase Plb3 [Microthyrium microscopicum]|uniref:Lysophospholipase n=1 Tax=Microthyrium microscopicum TaxID=703497 RepID=A0A6A6TYT3_9PEZI|nr:lysophospholipase Plb3 [Microthyrium microscopicum]
MYLTIGVLFLLQFISGAAAAPNDLVHLLKRASQSSYAPSVVACPASVPTVSSANALSPNETAWLASRRPKSISALRDFLSRANLSGFDTNAYLDNHLSNPSNLPNLGIAFSGGGWRALTNGAGALAAFDIRTSNSTAKGHLGGLLQSATYVAGLSGGSWLLASNYYNGFQPIESYLTGKNGLGSLWQFDTTILTGPRGLIHVASYFDDLTSSVGAKESAGFDITLTDYWGRALSYQLFDSSDGRPDFHFSSLAQSLPITSGDAPLPLIVIDQRAPGELLIPVNTTNFEVSPWEFGSYDASTNGYVPLEYVGSDFNGGSAKTCVKGFDNLGFVVGTSSSLFNQFYLNLNDTDINKTLKSLLNDVLAGVGAGNEDISDWPNPFYGYGNGTAQNSAFKNLTLVDGGEDLQNIPFHPLLRASRDVDVIFAVDSSADTSNWPNGTAMVATYQRFASGLRQGASGFPSIPDQNTFINLGLNSRPSFFGCDAGNNTAGTPLVVYMPMSPISYFANISTFDLSIPDSQRNSIIANGYGSATRANGTLDPEWPACAGCAVLSRSFNRTGTTVPKICEGCFSRYCWNGTIDSRTPKPYLPSLVAKTSGGSRGLECSGGLVVMLASIVSAFTLI